MKNLWPLMTGLLLSSGPVKTHAFDISPECVNDSECPTNKACGQQLCTDPCLSFCGIHSECFTFNHTPACRCMHGYVMDASGKCVTTSPQTTCNRDDQCPSGKICSKEKCKDPCQGSDKACADNAVCMVSDNEPTRLIACTCPQGFSGDGRHECEKITEPTRALMVLPTQKVRATCHSDGVDVEVRIPREGFHGLLYVEGHSKDAKCRKSLSLGAEGIDRTETFAVNHVNCGFELVRGEASFVMVIQKHARLVTNKAEAYRIKCTYQTGEQTPTVSSNVRPLPTVGTIVDDAPPPTCVMKITTETDQEISTVEVGQNLVLKVEVRPTTIYGGFARNCVAKTNENVEDEYTVTDANGCATDRTIFSQWRQGPNFGSLLVHFSAFKFPSSDKIIFQCNIKICVGPCYPANCGRNHAFGRRRRDVDAELHGTVFSVSDNYDGQLREEMTVASNVIKTLEPKEERYTSDSAGAAQRVEDVSVSMICFVVALVITTLVAVASAFSRWLTAYRRQPRIAGPPPLSSFQMHSSQNRKMLQNP